MVGELESAGVEFVGTDESGDRMEVTKHHAATHNLSCGMAVDCSARRSHCMLGTEFSADTGAALAPVFCGRPVPSGVQLQARQTFSVIYG